MTSTAIDQLKAALKAYKVSGHITLERVDPWAVEVFVNGESFGVWDIVKGTFVA